MSDREDMLLGAIARAVQILQDPPQPGADLRNLNASNILRQTMADVAERDADIQRAVWAREKGDLAPLSDDEIDQLLQLDCTSNDFAEQCDGPAARSLLLEVQSRRRQSHPVNTEELSHVEG